MPVYMVQASDSLVKIGWARDVKKRVSALQIAAAHPLTVLRTIEGERHFEGILHDHFHAERVRGEWFNFRPEMLSINPAEMAMPRKKKPRKKASRFRDGYDAPLLLYLKEGTREAIRARYGPRSEARTIRHLLAAVLGQKPD